MGNCTSANYRKITELSTIQQEKTYNQIRPYLDLEHPFNINNKYNIIIKILPTVYTGKGIKKANAYISLIPEAQLKKRVEEFWDSRQGLVAQKLCWEALKKVCSELDGNSDESFSILAKQELKLIDGSIQLSFDPKSHRYEIPLFCINPPQSYEKDPPAEFAKTKVKFTLRTKQTNDIQFEVNNEITVEALKSQIQDQIPGTNIRLFLKGRELKDTLQLGCYDINGHIVQAFIT